MCRLSFDLGQGRKPIKESHENERLMSFIADSGVVEELAGGSSSEIVHSDFERRFDTESEWKGELESKASTLLGFVGAFIVLLFSTELLWSDKIQDTLILLGVPMIFQILAAFLLFFIISGYATAIGPAFTSVFKDMNQDPEVLRKKLAVGYAASTLQNRVLFSRRVLYFQVAVLLVAGSYLLLGLNMGAIALGWFDTTDSISGADEFQLLAIFIVVVVVFVFAIMLKLILDSVSQEVQQEEALAVFKSELEQELDKIVKFVPGRDEPFYSIDYMNKSEEKIQAQLRVMSVMSKK